MASKSKNKGETPEANKVKFVEGSLWTESVLNAIKDTPNVIKKIEEFKNLKEQDPLALFGNKDFSFGGVPNSYFAKYMPKARKATLTVDYSIVYDLSGRNPTVIKLYGVFNHADMGTGQPPNKNVQKNLAKRLAGSFNESIEAYLRKLLQE